MAASAPSRGFGACLCLCLVAVALGACGGANPSVDVIAAPAALAEPTPLAEKSTLLATGEVYRFAKRSNGAYFFTGSAEERDQILAFYPDFRYEGVGFLRFDSGTGAVPVYRFANLSNGGYFYTASEEERAFVQQTRPDLRFEGTTFNVVSPGTPNALPVIRLANLQNGAYLYTTSQAEVSFAVGTGLWRAEGTAFHVPGVPVARPITGSGFEAQLLTGQPRDCADGQDGCGGGGGSDGSDGSDGGSGIGASDGQLSGAIAELWRPFNGELKLLGSAPVGALSGMVTLIDGTYNGPLWVVFKGRAGGSYFDEAVGEDRPFAAGDELNLLLPTRSARRNFGASVLTDAAFRLALARWGSPDRSRQQNIAAILTDERIEEAHQLVRFLVNRQLPGGLQVNDITRLPQVLGARSRANSLANNPNGAYALLLAAFSEAARSFSAQVAAARGSGTTTTTPGRDFTRQLALDLSDGTLDAAINGQPLVGAQNRVYKLSDTDASLPPSDNARVPVLSVALIEALQAMSTRYASAELTAALRPTAASPATACSGLFRYSFPQSDTITNVGIPYDGPPVSITCACGSTARLHYRFVGAGSDVPTRSFCVLPNGTEYNSTPL